MSVSGYDNGRSCSYSSCPSHHSAQNTITRCVPQLKLLGRVANLTVHLIVVEHYWSRQRSSKAHQWERILLEIHPCSRKSTYKSSQQHHHYYFTLWQRKHTQLWRILWASILTCSDLLFVTSKGVLEDLNVFGSCPTLIADQLVSVFEGSFFLCSGFFPCG